MQHSGFVLVAGGLGERLGYNGIKVSLPVETLTMTFYLEFYIRKILSFQVILRNSSHPELNPVSGVASPPPRDHDLRLEPRAVSALFSLNARTLQFLEEHKYFGMDRSQVFLMKQDEVPSVVDAACHLAVRPDGHLLRKPHGHGDVHLCLFRVGRRGEPRIRTES